jgi:mRNA interferase MazF
MENEKNFNEWNEKKRLINSFEKVPIFQVGQIWWAQIGLNVATEIDGKGADFLRPIVIVQKVYGDACLAIPLTSTQRIGDYYASFKDGKGKSHWACLAQTRYLDSKRLKCKFSFVKKEVTSQLRDSLCALIKK